MSLYDSYTKDKELSYKLFVKNSLDILGFRKNTIGTKYLLELIIFTNSQDYFNIFVNKICKDFLDLNNLKNISSKQFLDNINYSIKNVDISKFKSNFYKVFHTEYDVYYLTTKNILVLFLNTLENFNNKF